MVLHAEKHGGAHRSYRIGDVQMNDSNLFKVHRKVPEKDCPETLETEVTANGSVAVGSGSLTLLFPRPESRRSRPTGIRFDFSQTVPGPDRPGGGRNRSGLCPPRPALPVGSQGAHSFLLPSCVSDIRWRMPRAIPGLDNACARMFPAAVVPSTDASACGRGPGPALDPRDAGFETKCRDVGNPGLASWCVGEIFDSRGLNERCPIDGYSPRLRPCDHGKRWGGIAEALQLDANPCPASGLGCLRSISVRRRCRFQGLLVASLTASRPPGLRSGGRLFCSGEGFQRSRLSKPGRPELFRTFFGHMIRRESFQSSSKRPNLWAVSL